MADTTLLSNLSYVNKDFQSIYVELLDLVHKLTRRWDPSISNESDPGVLLIKLMAICTDKTNYTSDKNVLECFPESVTQEPNARQLFEQLGYTMRWYRSATTTISMRWIVDKNNEESIYSYIIPRFSMVSDDNNSIVYTITDEPIINGDGSTTSVNVIQGVAENYAINGEELITPANLDANNRLYFSDRNVAENGIFICNADSTISNGRQENYDSWKRVTNLAVEPLGQYCYKFGVANDGESCYIEFPDDIQALMGEGIYITYVVTDGENGNVSARVLEKFYSDVTISDPSDPDNDIVLNSSNVSIVNVSSATNGYDPESISSAYRNYKKTVGTFNTLVTLRDYANAIIESGYVSNGFVCDRTNDIQTSYSIVSNINDVAKYVTCVEEDNGEPLMEAFDLKLFLLKYVERPSSIEDYNTTFDVLVNYEDAVDPAIDSVLGYIKDSKSVQHDFEPILPNKLVMFRNKYNINCKVIPQYRVTTLQEEEIRKAVISALINNLNSKQVDFGEEVTFAVVYDIILNADERIKAITLDTLDYTTYAVYYDGSKYQEVPLGDLKIDHIGYYYNGVFYYDPLHTLVIIAVPGEYYYDYTSGKIYTYTTQYEESPSGNFALEVYVKSVLHGNTPWVEHIDNFAYNINQSAIGEVDDVAKVDTDTVFTISAPAVSSGTAYGSATVRANEVVQFYAPNLIDVMNYSNYVRYQFKLNANAESPILAANSDYALRSGESLVVFWREDENATDYFYRKYGEGTVIKASFPITRPTPPSVTPPAIPQVYVGDCDGMPVGDGSGITTAMTITYPVRYLENASAYEYTTDPLTTYIEQKMNGSAFTTTSSKTITIRDKNKVTIDGTKFKCYWKLNSKNSDGMYELFPSALADETQSYILQSGEYFFYTPMDESSLAYFGEGTKIIRECSSASNAMVCEVVDISQFMTDGITSFGNYWVTLARTYELIGEEMQFYALGEGTEIGFRRNSGGDAFTVQMTYDGMSWTVGQPNISDYTITYKLKDSTEEETLPNVVLAGDESWDGRVVLNFVPTPSNPQELYANQSIKYYLKDGTLGGSIDGNDTNPVCLMADYAYAIDGGHNIDITRMNSDGEIIYAKMYWYVDTIDQTTPIDAVEYLSNGNTRVTLDGVEDVHIFFKLPTDYMFILPLYNPNSGIDALGVTINGSDLPDIYATTDLSGSGMHYLLFDGASYGGTTVEMVVHAEISDGESKVVTFRPLFAFEEPSSTSIFWVIRDALLRLDTDHVFDFTYDIDEDSLIENPLDPNSFLDPNHIFNKFTICQMDISRLTVFITNKIK